MINKTPIVILSFLSLLLICAIVHQCQSYDSGEIYFEDVRVLIIGRCCTIFSSQHPIIFLHAGKLKELGIDISDKPLERLYIFINNGTKPGFSIGPTNNSIHISNLTGVIFYGILKQYSAGKIPPIIFVSCHAEQIWIREPGWEP